MRHFATRSTVAVGAYEPSACQRRAGRADQHAQHGGRQSDGGARSEGSHRFPSSGQVPDAQTTFRLAAEFHDSSVSSSDTPGARVRTRWRVALLEAEIAAHRCQECSTGTSAPTYALLSRLALRISRNVHSRT